MFVSFLSTLLGSLLSISITCLMAFSITIVFRTSSTANFAQSGISVLGCYFVAWLFNSGGLPVGLGAPLGMIFGALTGIGIDFFIFRRRNIDILSRQIITMGFLSFIIGVIPLIFGSPEKIPFEPFYHFVRYNQAPNFVIRVNGGEIAVTKHALISLMMTSLILGIAFRLLKSGKWGLGIRATASNEYTAELMGINTTKSTLISWALASALGVLSAVIYAGSGVPITPTFMATVQVNAFLACVLGGFGTFYGPVIGAILIPILSSCVGFMANVKGFESISEWRTAIVYSLILLMILMKPSGLFGGKIVKKL